MWQAYYIQAMRTAYSAKYGSMSYPPFTPSYQPAPSQDHPSASSVPPQNHPSPPTPPRSGRRWRMWLKRG